MKGEKEKELELNNSKDEKETVEVTQSESESSKKENGLKEENEKLKKEIEELKQKLNELNDAYLRKVADFDNYRKRMLKQLEEAETEGIKKMAKEIIPVVDNFEKALNSSVEKKDFDNLYEGLKIIYSLMSEVMNKFNIKPFSSVGQEFDHNLHEAVMMEERDDVEFNHTVVEEYEKGYFFKDGILRHAKVKVGKKKNN